MSMTFLVVTAGDATGIWGVEVSDAIKHPKMHRTAPTSDAHVQDHDVSSAEFGKPALTSTAISPWW